MSTKRGNQFDDDVLVEDRTSDKSKSEKATPRMWKVLLHNDDFTTMEFVVAVLTTVFHHNEEDAHRIMLAVHQRGIGVAGLYPFETAEAKCARVLDLARQRNYPLMCSIEPEA